MKFVLENDTDSQCIGSKVIVLNLIKLYGFKRISDLVQSLSSIYCHNCSEEEKILIFSAHDVIEQTSPSKDLSGFYFWCCPICQTV